MDCCDLRLTSGQLAKRIQTCPFNVGLWHKCTLFCGGYGKHDGSMLSMAQWWTSGLRILTTFLDVWLAPGFDPVECILCTHFTLYFVYRIRRVSQKICSYQHYNMIEHNFPQFPPISQYFPTFSRYHGFFYPVSAFPHLQGGPHAPTRAIGGSKSTPCLGARDMGLIFLLRMRFNQLFKSLHILEKVLK